MERLEKWRTRESMTVPCPAPKEQPTSGITRGESSRGYRTSPVPESDLGHRVISDNAEIRRIQASKDPVIAEKSWLTCANADEFRRSFDRKETGDVLRKKAAGTKKGKPNHRTKSVIRAAAGFPPDQARFRLTPRICALFNPCLQQLQVMLRVWPSPVQQRSGWLDSAYSPSRSIA